jgi:transcriptional regulator with XRE-family HTH domain
MNALEIKQNRKKLKLTQAELAIKLGVSLKTVSNYENGEVIPETKLALLRAIFKIDSNNTLNEPLEEYEINGIELKVKQTLALIKEHKKIIELSKEKKKFDKIEFHSKIIELLKEQIELLTDANANKFDDDEILKTLSKKKE